MQSIGLIVLLGYFAIMIAIGLIAAKLQRSTTDFWVANRGFGWFILGVAILASIMNGGTLIGGTGAIAARGAITLNNLAFALGFLIVILFMADKLRRFGGFTLPDFLGDRYESNGFRAFSAIVVLVASVVTLIAQTKAMAIVVSQLSGLSLGVSLVLAAAIFIFYTSIGGMLAAVWTDIAQWLFMTVGLGALIYALWPQVGGITGMALSAEAAAPGWTSLLGTGWSAWGLFSWYLVWFIAYFTRIEFVTKMYTAKDERSARVGVAFGLVLVLVFFSSTVFFGGAARVLVWDQAASPDAVFPLLARNYLNPFWAAMCLAGVAAAAMSTVSSLLLLSGAALAHDLLRKSYYEPKGVDKSEAFYLKASRWTTVGVGAVAMILAFNTPTLVLQIVSYGVALTGSAFAMPMLLGLVWKRTSPVAAYASAVGGFVGSGIWAILTEMGYGFAATFHPILPGIIISVVLILGLTAVLPPASDATIQRFFARKPQARPAMGR